MSRNADRHYRDGNDSAQPRKHVDWTNVLAGLLVAVGGAMFGRVLTKSDALGDLQTKAQIIPDRRDREVDTLERRVAALENRRCAP